MFASPPCLTDRLWAQYSHDCIPRTRPMSASHDRVPCTCWPRRPWPRRPFPPYDPFGRGGRPLKELPVLSLVPQDRISARSPLYLVTRGRPSWAARPFPRSCHLHSFPSSIWPREAVPPGQRARSRGFRRYLLSPEGACLACVSWTTAFAPLPPACCVLGLAAR